MWKTPSKLNVKESAQSQYETIREININRSGNLSALIVEKYKSQSTSDSPPTSVQNLTVRNIFYIHYFTAGGSYSGPAAKTAPIAVVLQA